MRKIILFIFSIICVCGIFVVKVNAAVTGVTIQSATASYDNDEESVMIDIVMKSTPSADKLATYVIDVKTLIDHYHFEYLEEEHFFFYAIESTPNDKHSHVTNSVYYSINDTFEFTLFDSSSNVLYYLTIKLIVDEAVSINGNVIDYLPLSIKQGTGNSSPSVDSVYSTAASITMNSTSGRGTISGTIDFSSNTYQAGWYAIDLNYVKEYYGFKVNLSSANISCSSNSELNSGMSGSVNVDSNGNLLYFALPSLSNIT